MKHQKITDRTLPSIAQNKHEYDFIRSYYSKNKNRRRKKQRVEQVHLILTKTGTDLKKS